MKRQNVVFEFMSYRYSKLFIISEMFCGGCEVTVKGECRLCLNLLMSQNSNLSALKFNGYVCTFFSDSLFIAVVQNYENMNSFCQESESSVSIDRLKTAR